MTAERYMVSDHNRLSVTTGCPNTKAIFELKIWAQLFAEKKRLVKDSLIFIALTKSFLVIFVAEKL